MCFLRKFTIIIANKQSFITQISSIFLLVYVIYEILYANVIFICLTVQSQSH